LDGDLYESLPPIIEHQQPPPSPIAGPSQQHSNTPVLTNIDYKRIEEYSRMELDLGNYTEPEPHEVFGDLRLEVNTLGQPAGQSTLM
jgi:hypothetical protein